MTIFADGDSKSIMFQQRYNMIHQNILLDSRFTDSSRGSRGADFPIISSKGNTEKARVNESSLLQMHTKGHAEAAWRVQLTPPESLSGSTGMKVVFGMLTKGADGKFFVEDTHQAAEVRLDNCGISDDLITENTFVLLKGEVVDDLFHASEMTIPPIPQLSLSEAALNVGAKHLLDEVRIGDPETDAPEDSSVAILAGVLLDKPQVLDKINSLLTGFEECEAVPSVFVLMGNFLSTPFNAYNGDSCRAYQKGFEKLAIVLSRHPATLERTTIVLVPGQHEPGHGILPQPPLSDILLRGLATRFSNVVLASNPCRLKYYNKNMVFYAGSISSTLQRNRLVCNYQSTDSQFDGDKIMRSVLSQMSLVPGPVRDQAVIWDLDSTLRLYPPPNALYISDELAEVYQTELHRESLFATMPKFASEEDLEAEFYLYSPHQKENTLSSV